MDLLGGPRGCRDSPPNVKTPNDTQLNIKITLQVKLLQGCKDIKIGQWELQSHPITYPWISDLSANSLFAHQIMAKGVYKRVEIIWFILEHHFLFLLVSQHLILIGDKLQIWKCLLYWQQVGKIDINTFSRMQQHHQGPIPGSVVMYLMVLPNLCIGKKPQVVFVSHHWYSYIQHPKTSNTITQP